MIEPPSDTFVVETRNGFRRVEFDPDVYRFRDVRILVDGSRVAEMPFPKSRTPTQRVSFDLDGHQLVGVAYLTEQPSTTDLQAIRYDLFANGRSLRDDVPIGQVLARAAAPGKAYPLAFQVIDVGLQVAPAASAPGLSLGVLRNGAELGWVVAAALVAGMLLGVGVATALARAAWLRIRSRELESVARRTGLGCLAVTGIYVAMVVAALGVILLIRP